MPISPRAVSAWRERLADLDATAEALAPSAALWDRIAELHQGETGDPAARRPRRAARRNAVGQYRLLARHRDRRVFAALMLVVILIGALATSRQLRRELIALAQRKPIYVAVLVNDATRETGAIVNTFSNGRVELVPLRPIDVPAGRTLQVWTLWDRAVGPKSIGLTGQSRTLQLESGSIAGYCAKSVVRDHAGARRRLADRTTDRADPVQGQCGEGRCKVDGERWRSVP